ncbi:18371_t:CDS:2, partial [Racocetra persica]
KSLAISSNESNLLVSKKSLNGFKNNKSYIQSKSELLNKNNLPLQDKRFWSTLYSQNMRFRSASPNDNINESDYDANNDPIEIDDTPIE